MWNTSKNIVHFLCKLVHCIVMPTLQVGNQPMHGEYVESKWLHNTLCGCSRNIHLQNSLVFVCHVSHVLLVKSKSLSFDACLFVYMLCFLIFPKNKPTFCKWQLWSCVPCETFPKYFRPQRFSLFFFSWTSTTYKLYMEKYIFIWL